MPSYTLTDASLELRAESFDLSASDLGVDSAIPWSIAKRTLRGGRRDGVDLIEVDNGVLRVAIVPTRGMGLWKARHRADSVGWQSPVDDGPVHPSLVNLAGLGGFGWLDGFDELLARCGLESVGPPFAEGPFAHGLHGRIANIPAHRVAVHADADILAVEGVVDETRVFGPRLRLTTRIATAPGSNHLVVRDEVANLKDTPGEFQLLYHWNFGPPHLEAGSRFVAPIAAIAPRDAAAARDVDRHDEYAGPTPGFAEQVYFYRLLDDAGRTVTLLRNRAGDKGVALRFSTAQLPCFTLWKNTAALGDGYVTGLEPGTSFPNPKPHERDRGRVATLPPGGSFVAETSLEVLDTAEGVAGVEEEIRSLRSRRAATVHQMPTDPLA